MGLKAIIEGGSEIASAKIAANASRHASDNIMGMYNQTRSDLMPFMTTGNSALSQLASLWGLGPGGNGTPNAQAAMSQLTQFPGYQFGLQQGTTASDQAAASKGLVLSGGQLEAQNQFGQNYAMQQAWNPYVSQLNTLATMGQDSAAKVGTIGAGAASGSASAIMAGGAAGAGAAQGIGNIFAQNGPFQGSTGSAYGASGGGSYLPNSYTMGTGLDGSYQPSGDSFDISRF